MDFGWPCFLLVSFPSQHTKHQVTSKTYGTRYDQIRLLDTRHPQISTIATTIMISASIENLDADPLTAQERFAQSVELNQPGKAMTSYQELMHQHTMQQFEVATASSQMGPSGTSGTAPPILKSDSPRPL